MQELHILVYTGSAEKKEREREREREKEGREGGREGTRERSSKARNFKSTMSVAGHYIKNLPNTVLCFKKFLKGSMKIYLHM
jgi:hypothetical protein